MMTRNKVNPSLGCLSPLIVSPTLQPLEELVLPAQQNKECVLCRQMPFLQILTLANLARFYLTQTNNRVS